MGATVLARRGAVCPLFKPLMFSSCIKGFLFKGSSKNMFLKNINARLPKQSGGQAENANAKGMP